MPYSKVRLASAAFAGAILVFLSACGGGSRKSSSTAVTNTLAVVVNAGPTGNYANGLFATVTVCAPGTSNCQAINGVLVDTGSFGLRILSSALNASLASALSTETIGSGSDLVECAQFSDGITWGPVKTADIKLGGETAASLPVQVVGDPSFAAVPAGCTSAGAPEDTLQKLGTNGILGIGSFVQDCPACGPETTSNPGFYYACTGSSCAVTTAGLAQQVANPTAFFPTDNNGLIVELPAATSSAVSLSGSVIFGIGTENNNSLGSAQVFTLDPQTGNFSTTFMNHTYMNSSFLDSGSNAYFFLSSSVTGFPTCSDASGFYCPASFARLSATNTGANNASSSISFAIDNADTLFSSAANAVFPTLGGPFAGTFDWGLPFFYGRNVYVAIAGRSTPGGTGPYWAY
ncbi:MAG TPA: DUF3443 domain-containing protein [Terriglobales bacterium]|nr:DUF3443 domain-containing protein [Terriglobales bacterium]